MKAYFPADTWYNYDNGSIVPFRGAWVSLPGPLDTINVHQRGGSVIPTQRDAVTTTAARQLPFSLQIALDQRGQANGSMYWDDGETIGKSTVYFILRFILISCCRLKENINPYFPFQVLLKVEGIPS